MADIGDVLDVLAGQCEALVYPQGTTQPSVSQAKVVIYPGWPTPAQLDRDLAAGAAHVSVFATGAETNSTRYQPKAQVVSQAAPTVTLTASGKTVTVGGAIPSPFAAQNIAVIVGGAPYVHPLQSNDTLVTIATALAALIPGATNTGPVLTLPQAPDAARVGGVAGMATEWERQTQRVQITVWAPTPASRKAIASAIKAGLAQISFLVMPDGFGARIKSVASALSDGQQKVALYRRDLIYEVEYATTVASTAPVVVAHTTTIQEATTASVTN